MADQERNAGNAIFGLNEPEARRTAAETSTANSQGTQGAQGPQGTQVTPGSPVTPQYVYVQGPPPSAAPASGGKILTALGIVLIVLTLVNLYMVITVRQQFTESAAKQSDQLNLLTRRMDSSDERYAQLSGKFQVTTEKLGLTQQELNRARSLASNIQKQQQAAVQKLNDAIAQKASAEEVNKLQSDANAKFGNLSGDIAGTKKELEETKQALTGAKGELSGAIARTHDELVALAHRTDRDYFEFNLARKGSRQKVGTVVVELAKTNPKKNQFTVNLYFDDKRTERKDKAVNEPVYFYVQGASSAVELVVNKLSRDTIAGYLSAPKGFFPNTPNVLSARPGA